MKTTKNEITPLNTLLYDDFYVQELENRLETDPLSIGGILEMDSSLPEDELEPQCFIDQCTKTCYEHDSCMIEICPNFCLIDTH